MNRRDFTKSLAAAATLPALPIPLGAVAKPATPKISLRFLAVYLSGLQGKFTPEMVTQMTGMSNQAASRLVQNFVAEKLITPAHAAGHVAIGSSFPLPGAKPLAPLSKPSGHSDKSEKLKTLAKRLDDLTQDEQPIDEDAQEAPDEQA